MPCRGPDDYDREALRAELDSVTEMLCELCGAIESGTSYRQLLEMIEPQPATPLHSWWSRHRALDAKRVGADVARAVLGHD